MWLYWRGQVSGTACVCRYCLVDFGLAQDVKNDTPALCAAAPATALPPTPHLQLGRPVKRKLPVEMCHEMSSAPSCSKRLKPSYSTPQLPPVPRQGSKGVLTVASSARLNSQLLGMAVRRSPRKLTNQSPAKKENIKVKNVTSIPGTSVNTSFSVAVRTSQENAHPFPLGAVNGTQKNISDQIATEVQRSADEGKNESCTNSKGGDEDRIKNLCTPCSTSGSSNAEKVISVTPRKISTRSATVTSAGTSAADGTITPVKKRSSARVGSGSLSSPIVPVITPRKTQALQRQQLPCLLDSPSKHTRMAEAARRQEQRQPDEGVLQSVSGPTPKVKGPKNATKHSNLGAAPVQNPVKALDRTRSKTFFGVQNSSIVSDQMQNCSPSLTDHKDSCAIPSASSYRPVSLTRGSEVMSQAYNSDVKKTKDEKDVRALFAGKGSGGCRCYGRGEVCKRCMVRVQQPAARAGTPGFRPPEVLLRHPHQHTVGVVGLCLTSGRHPFFRAPDDHTALAELCTLFSFRALRRIAATLGKLLLCSEERPALDLRKVCENLRLCCAFRDAASSEARDDGGTEKLTRSNSADNGDDVANLKLRFINETFCCVAHKTCVEDYDIINESGPCNRCLQSKVCLCAHEYNMAFKVDSDHSKFRKANIMACANSNNKYLNSSPNCRTISCEKINNLKKNLTTAHTHNSLSICAQNTPTGEYLTRLCKKSKVLSALPSHVSAYSNLIKNGKTSVKNHDNCKPSSEKPNSRLNKRTSENILDSTVLNDNSMSSAIDSVNLEVKEEVQCVEVTYPDLVGTDQKAVKTDKVPAFSVLPTTPKLPRALNKEFVLAKSSPGLRTQHSEDLPSHRRRRGQRPPLYNKPYPRDLYNLIERLLDLNPNTRISASAALKHPFLQGARINS
ncbi:Protein kinase-like domain [Trinorchestia longiramus]|nr:Protein kinase-like domain [Trinorchestia longiramus]